MHETIKAIPHGVAYFILPEKMLAFRRGLQHCVRRLPAKPILQLDFPLKLM
jgi:hypothetical protein